MHFITTGVPQQASDLGLVYRAAEYSFDSLNPGAEEVASVLVNDLNLGLNAAGHVVSVWGLCSHLKWQRAPVSPPFAESGTLALASDEQLARGVSKRINEGDYWPAFVDPASGWVQLRGSRSATRAIAIDKSVVVELSDEGTLVGIFLKPATLPNLNASKV